VVGRVLYDIAIKYVPMNDNAINNIDIYESDSPNMKKPAITLNIG
jgi:hypothetical protein